MAKLSVYNTIDRSQLGGKFVPLIQSGVNNYKILASDLGKEYHPGDAIEITDTGEINVNYDQNTLELSGSELSVKTDYDRGVFIGSDGIYIASADSTINVSSYGISVNRSDLVSRIPGAGLTVKGDRLYVKSADDTIGVSSDGIKVNTSALSIPDAYFLAGRGLGAIDSNTLYVQPANGSISSSSVGIKVDASFLAGHYLSVGSSNHDIIVDTASVARAITGSGLVTTNGAIGVNVNTATGIIVKDNKLYLNSGDGLQTSNNAVSVKAADKSINVLSSGIKVNTGYGLSATADGLYVQPSDSSIYVSSGGVRVRVREGGGILSGDDGLYFDSGAIELPSAGSLSGAGLGHTYSNLYVMSADNSIGVSNDGIKVNTYALAGYGLSAASDGLSVHLYGNTNIKISDDGGYLYAAADFMAGEGLKAMRGTALGVNYGSGLGIDNNGLLAVKLGDRLGFDPYGYVYAASSYTVGPGLTHSSGELQVLPADNSIGVSTGGIKVNLSALAGAGLDVHSNGTLYVRSSTSAIRVSNSGIGINVGYGLAGRNDCIGVQTADNSIAVSEHGIKVKAGYGLSATSDGLYVKSADNSIDVSSNGIKVDTLNLAGSGLGGAGGLYVKSADNTIGVTDAGVKVNTGSVAAAIFGQGLEYNSGKLNVYYGSGLAIDTETGKLYATSVTPEIGQGLLLFSRGASPAELSVYAGSGLTFDTKNRLSVYAGSGLEVDSEGRLYVKSADNTIDVSSAGIKVNKSALSVSASSLAGNGLIANPEGKLDIYYGSGLDIDKSLGKVIVKSADNSIDVSDNGIKVRTYDNHGVFVGNHGVYTRSADSSIGLSTAGIKVNVKSGGGILVGEQGLYIDNTSSSSGIEGIDVDAMGASATAGSGSVSVGSGANAAGGYSISVGVLANATANESVVIGYLSSANVDSSRSIAIGSESRVGSAFSVAIGNASKAYSESSVVIGDLAYTLSAHSIAIGRSSYTYAASSVAIGPYSLANGSRSIAIGSESYANSASTIAIGYSSSSGTNSVAIGAGSSAPNTYCLSAGYMSSATGTESVALGVNSDAGSFGVAIGSQSNALEYGVAIGYNASATKGIISLRVAHSTGEHFEYKYGYDGSLIAKDTSGANYIRSWENLITPPDPSTKTTINSGTTYTADKPLWIGGSGYSGGGLLLAEFYINEVYVGCVSASNNNSDAFIVPVAKGDTYKINLKHNGGNTPTFFRMYCQ